MVRWTAAILLAWALTSPAQDRKDEPARQSPKQDELKRERPKPPVSEQEEVPPEEDVSVAPTEYSFNPLQAEKDLRTGNYYYKKGSFRAAAMRYREATRWNEGYGEAWLRLGIASEKLKDKKSAREAYAKYLETVPDAKDAPEIRKKVEKLK
jgi:tetratricopeptide (TPR) repeat protein